MIEILTKIRGKITIIVVGNREPYYFIIIYECKEVPLSLFSCPDADPLWRFRARGCGVSGANLACVHAIRPTKHRYPYSLIRCRLQLWTPMSSLVTIRSMVFSTAFGS